MKRKTGKQIKGEAQERSFQLTISKEGERSRYSASLSSETPVERWFGTEILSHDAKSVNLGRASRGLPLLFNHDMNEPLGKIRNVRIEDGKLRGDLEFGGRAKALEIQGEVDGGFLGDISVRYLIDEYDTRTDEHGHDTITATRWTPLEGSIVSVPADPNVGVGRKYTKVTEETRMDENEDDNTGTPVPPKAGGTVAELKGRLARSEERGAKRALAAEAERVEEVQEIFSLANPSLRGDEFDALRDQCIRDRIKPDQARKLLMELIDGHLPTQVPTPSPSRDTSNGNQSVRAPFVQAGVSDIEKTNAAIQRAIELRSGMLSAEERKAEIGTNEYLGYTLLEMGRAWAHKTNQRITGMLPTALAGLLLNDGRRTVVGLGTEDFTGILANVASKALLAGWEESQSTWQQWCRRGTLNDFKRTNRTGLSGVTLLDVVPENSEITYGKLTDRTEYIQAVTYAKLFKISRQALINDDLGAFTTMPKRLGAAADRTINKAVYDLLVSAAGLGPTLNQDAVALFNAASHFNYVATAGAPSVTNLDVGRQAMRRQKDPNNAQPLNISPKYLLVPTALETTSNVLVASEYDPVGLSGAVGGATAPNPFRGKLQVIAEPTLDDATNGTTAWYLLGDQNQYDTMEVAFVDGQSVPYIETQDSFNIDGTSMKVRLDFAVAALDFRAMWRKRGA